MQLSWTRLEGRPRRTMEPRDARSTFQHPGPYPMSPYGYLDHTADMGIAASGASLEETFVCAGEALAAFLCAPETVRDRETREIEVSAADREALLVAWLNEVNYRFEVDRFAFRAFKIRELSDTALRAVGRGEPLDPSRHRVGQQVKSVTYHELSIRQDPNGFAAQVYLDI